MLLFSLLASRFEVNAKPDTTSISVQEEHTEVVEAPWGQPLREVGGKQETGEEGKEEVVTVTGHGVARAAASPAADKYLQSREKKTATY